MTQQVYVTGSSGMLGRGLLASLDHAGFAVTGVARPAPSGAGALPERAQIVAPDLLGGAWLPDQETGATVVHCAGLSSARAPFEGVGDLVQREVLAQIGMVEALVARGWHGHLVYLSSAAVYGDPETLPISEAEPTRPKGYYALQKVMIEDALRFLASLHGFALTILRVANPYGTAHPETERGVLRLLLDAARDGTPFTVFGGGGGLRDYLHVSDFGAAVAQVCARPPETPRCLNLGSGQGTSLTDLIAEVERATGRDLDIRHAPSTMEVGSNVLDIAAARAHLDWSPRMPLGAGVARMAADHRAAGARVP